MDNLSIPFGQFRVALADFVQVVGWVDGVGQCRNHINNDKPPFVAMNDAADFLSLDRAIRFSGFKLAHRPLLVVVILRPALFCVEQNHVKRTVQISQRRRRVIFVEETRRRSKLRRSGIGC